MDMLRERSSALATEGGVTLEKSIAFAAIFLTTGTQCTCFTGTQVQILTPEETTDLQQPSAWELITTLRTSQDICTDNRGGGGSRYASGGGGHLKDLPVIAVVQVGMKKEEYERLNAAVPGGGFTGKVQIF